MKNYFGRLLDNSKAVSLVKMLILSVALIAICVLSKDKLDKKHDTESLSGQTKYDFAMGTSISATIYGDDCYEDVFDIVKNLDSSVISWREKTSAIASLNENKSYVFKDADTDMIFREALLESYDICAKSKGALDITLRPLLDLWGIETKDEGNFVVPMDEVIMACHVAYEDIDISDDKVTIGDNMVVDLGSTGKGYALDKVLEFISTQDIDGATVSVGGSILCYGEKANGYPWKIGVRDPWGNQDDFIGFLSFDNIGESDAVCISTSGDYEKYIEKDGVRYHHIIDRKTGYPADSGLVSVTVVVYKEADNLPGLESDGLSTACFVLGYENSLPLLEDYDAEAVFIFSDGTIVVTDGLKDIFEEK